jgi:hypothetical protein
VIAPNLGADGAAEVACDRSEAPRRLVVFRPAAAGVMWPAWQSLSVKSGDDISSEAALD